MPYDLFISYAHRDNPRGQISELRDAISQDFQKFAGRNLTVFFDERDILSMADWEKHIAQGLSESRLFVAVLSPNYLASTYCRREWEEYVRYEAMRQCLGEGIAPIYFIELPGMDGPGVAHNIAAAVNEMRKRQWCDLASQKPVRIVPWHNAGKRALEDAEVARRLGVLKEQMAQRLSRADRAKRSPTNIYRHNAQFVGRVRELTLLRETLSERGRVGVVGQMMQGAGRATAVHGLGGMGKTELALAYAHAFAWDYPGGRWLVRCEGLEDFDTVLRQTAEPLGVVFTEVEQKDTRLAGERILAELRRRDRSLLLLDNVTHPGLLNPDVLMRLPPQGHIHLLATTRLGPAQLSGSPHDHTFLSVDELPADDALALIRAHQPERHFADAGDESAAREVVELLAGFTLAVETAAIYLGRHAAPGVIATLAGRLRAIRLPTSEDVAANPVVAVRHREKLLEITLASTFETLSAEHQHVLALAALLPPDLIALPWLRAIAGKTRPELRADSGTLATARWNRLTEWLLGLRLFQPTEDIRSVRMHRLVQELIRKRAGEQGVNMLYGDIFEHALQRGEFLLRNWRNQDNRWEVGPIACLAQFWLKAGFGAGAELANTSGIVLQGLGRFVEAVPQLEDALKFNQEALGLEHPEVARSMNNLATLRHHLCQWAEAESLYRQALAINERQLGTNHPEVAGNLSNLGALLEACGRHAEAEPLLRRALAILEATVGPDGKDLVQVLSGLGHVLKATNRSSDAEDVFRRAKAVAERNFGPTHPTFAICLNHLSLLFQDTGRWAESEPLLRTALLIEEKALGPMHPEIGVRLNNLARAVQFRGQLSEAEELFRRSLVIREHVFGSEHPEVAICLSNLADVLRQRHQAAEAERLIRRAVEMDRRLLEPNHPNIAIRLNMLAVVLDDLGRKRETPPLYRQVIEILVNFATRTGYQHPNLHQAIHNYLTVLIELGKSFDEAIAETGRAGVGPGQLRQALLSLQQRK